jgi:hypothetical protein
MSAASRRRCLQTTAAVAAGTVLHGSAEQSSLRAADAPPPPAQPPKRLEVNHDLHTHTLFSEGTLLHPPTDKQKYIENVVRTYLGLCDVPYLDAIAHPFNTGNTTPAALPADYPPRLLRELAEKKKVFDVMNDTIYWFSKAGIAPRTLTAQYVPRLLSR